MNVAVQERIARNWAAPVRVRRQPKTSCRILIMRISRSASTLSRLESGQRRPTLELLLALAEVHHVALDELVGAPATGDPRIHLRPVVSNGITWVPLSRNPGGLNAFKQIMPVNPHPPSEGPRYDDLTKPY
jgi:transcriptional regulator with XRE-family HTH domain